MDPLLVITNSNAGADDEESLGLALKVLRTHTSVEVQATSNPGELNSALHRAGSRRIVVAGGDGSLHAVVTTLYRRNDLKHAVLGISDGLRAEQLERFKGESWLSDLLSASVQPTTGAA